MPAEIIQIEHSHKWSLSFVAEYFHTGNGKALLLETKPNGKETDSVVKETNTNASKETDNVDKETNTNASKETHTVNKERKPNAMAYGHTPAQPRTTFSTSSGNCAAMLYATKPTIAQTHHTHSSSPMTLHGPHHTLGLETPLFSSGLGKCRIPQRIADSSSSAAPAACFLLYACMFFSYSCFLFSALAIFTPFMAKPAKKRLKTGEESDGKRRELMELGKRAARGLGVYLSRVETEKSTIREYALVLLRCVVSGLMGER
nr:hypothetical chloroplast RF19 [Ipomoea batatas]